MPVEYIRPAKRNVFNENDTDEAIKELADDIAENFFAKTYCSLLNAHIEFLSDKKLPIFAHRHFLRYEGNLNDIVNAVVLISFPVSQMSNLKALRAFIDISM